MKTRKDYLFILSLLFFASTFSQQLSSDADLITELMSQKQDEIKQRILKNLIVKNIKTTNYTSYNTMYNLMDIITTGKNKTVMTKNILTEITEYSISYSLANYFRNNIDNTEATLAISTSIKNPEKNALNFSINGEYKIAGDKNVEKKITVEKKTTLEYKIKEALLSNYIMDEIHQKVSLMELPFFESNGLFVNKYIDKKFTSDLDINYKDLDSIVKKTVDDEIDKFVVNLDKVSDKAYEVFDLIKQFKDGELDFKKLKDADNINIEKIFNLFSISLSNFGQETGKNSYLAKIGERINKYVIYESFDGDNDMVFDFKIDVEAIILSFEEVFINSSNSSLKQNKIGIKPFFTVGAHYGTFISTNRNIIKIRTERISDLSYVTERVGLKFMLFDFAYTHSQKPEEWYKYKGNYRKWNEPSSDPLIDNIFISVFGSGLLYNIIDLKSENKFDFPLVGMGVGVTLFNDLEFTISYSVPIIKNSFSYDNAMVGFGVDIPILKYLGALVNKL
jgi:hypothetical protein